MASCRCKHDFWLRVLTGLMPCPSFTCDASAAVAKDKIANMLLAVKGRGAASSREKVAQDLARDAAREQLKPLLETACGRLASVLHRSFDIAVEQEQTTTSEIPSLSRIPFACILLTESQAKSVLLIIILHGKAGFALKAT